MAWHAEHQGEFPEVSWFEFAAATGSTLGMFALFLASLDPNLSPAQAEAIVKAYFPWVCGLHILLDSVIDQQEDREQGDQNFMDCYRDQAEMRSRLKTFITESMVRVRTLPDPAFHQTVVTGLLAVYLSDTKIEKQRLSSMAWDLLRCGGAISIVNYLVCRWYRRRRDGV
jgi:tetraprenyl-beta-curcumene synthase